MIKIFQMMRNFFKNEKSSCLDSLILRLDASERKAVQFSEIEDHSFDKILYEASLALQNGVNNGALFQRFVALQYRLELVNGGINPVSSNKEDYEYLYHLARDWKQSNPLMGRKILSANEIAHLKTTAKYPKFLSVLKHFPHLQKSFFKWVLRDGNEAIPFIEYPATCLKLARAHLSGRISRTRISALKIAKEQNQKNLCLLFQGKFLSILNPEAKVTFRGNYVLSIEEIFEVFTNKEKQVGNLEFMREGIVNWNIHHLGYWNADQKKYMTIDIKLAKWWEQMPILEILNRRQMFKRYGIPLPSRGWIAAAVATRRRPSLDYDGTHAFLEVAIPYGEGIYSIYDFGKLATEYPSGLIDRLTMLTKTVHATVAYPDDNIYLTHRQKGFHPFLLNGRQGVALMHLIQEDIETARASNFIYQIESENCAKWVHFKLESVLGEQNVPDLFRMQLLDTEPVGVISTLFKGIKKLPASWQVPVLTYLHLPLGAARKIWIEENGARVAKSLSRHSFFNTGQIFLPALLVKKVIQWNFSPFFKKLIFKPVLILERFSYYDNSDSGFAGRASIGSRFTKALI